MCFGSWLTAKRLKAQTEGQDNWQLHFKQHFVADVKYRQMTHRHTLAYWQKIKKGHRAKVFSITISIELYFRCFFPLTCAQARTRTHTHDLCIYYSVISLQELFRSYYPSSPQKQNSSSLLSCSTSEDEDRQKGEETRVRYECVDKISRIEKR